MKLVLAQYLRTLRERDEFDVLLPVLVSQMGYVLLSRPQTGTRQHGVDFAAVGLNPDDGVSELLLFVLKQGDIGRRDWTGNPQAVRESMDEIVDVYLRSYVPLPYVEHRKVIIVATTGDLKEDTQPNWVGYTARFPQLRFDFWSGDRVAQLLEQHLLDENLFDAQDWSDLRRALALSGDREYRFQDFSRLLLRQLGLEGNGHLAAHSDQQDAADLTKVLRRVHLAASICAHWAESEGEMRQAVWVLERTALWCWHRASLQQLHGKKAVLRALKDIWGSYQDLGWRYFQKLKPFLLVQDGLSGGVRDGAEYSVVLMEHLGLLACIGLAHGIEGPVASEPTSVQYAIASAITRLLDNHAAASSPRLDGHCIDICLVLALLFRSGHHQAAREWLRALAARLNLVYRSKRLFPVDSDSLDDLAELDAGGSEELKTLLMQTSWTLATVASWCAVLGLDEEYAALARGHAQHYSEINPQLWHPAPEWPTVWYFGADPWDTGQSEVPYSLPSTARELRERIALFNDSRRLRWEEHSPTLGAGLWALDFVACRHFRIPVPASIWYQLRVPGLPAAAEPPEAAGDPEDE